MCKKNAVYLRPAPEDETIVRKFVPSTIPLQWVSQTTQDARDPRPTKATYRLKIGFIAAGKVYRSLGQLGHRETKTSGVFLDIYGREVVSFSERFPCFDSYDYLYENRYFRWFYIFDGRKLTEIYYEDERPSIEVVEDVREVPRKHWDTIFKVWGNHS